MNESNMNRGGWNLEQDQAISLDIRLLNVAIYLFISYLNRVELICFEGNILIMEGFYFRESKFCSLQASAEVISFLKIKILYNFDNGFISCQSNAA